MWSSKQNYSSIQEVVLKYKAISVRNSSTFLSKRKEIRNLKRENDLQVVLTAKPTMVGKRRGKEGRGGSFLRKLEKNTHTNTDILESNKHAIYFSTLLLKYIPAFCYVQGHWSLFSFLICLIWHFLLLLHLVCCALYVYKAFCYLCFLLAEDLCHCIRMLLQWINSSPPWKQKQHEE